MRREAILPKVAILFSGTGTTMEYILEHLHQKEVMAAVALTNNPSAEGIVIAQRYKIPLEVIDSREFESRELFDQKVVEALRGYDPKLTILAGFMRILTPVFTDAIPAINLHPSLLPRHKGVGAILKSYEDGYTEGGASVHWVTSKLDGGGIIMQQSIQKSTLSFEEYEEKIREIEKTLLADAIRSVLY